MYRFPRKIRETNVRLVSSAELESAITVLKYRTASDVQTLLDSTLQNSTLLSIILSSFCCFWTLSAFLLID